MASALYRNLPNLATVMGVLPLCVLFWPGGEALLPALLVYNNAMDDLDGALARGLGLQSAFGASLDNLSDAVAHIALGTAVGARFGVPGLVVSQLAAGAILLRMATRVTPGRPTGNGSTTNELMRHLLFLLLVQRDFGLDVTAGVLGAYVLNAVTMLVPFAMPQLLRTRATKLWQVGLINVALVVALLVPKSVVVVALPFVATYGWALVTGLKSLRRAPIATEQA